MPYQPLCVLKDCTIEYVNEDGILDPIPGEFYSIATLREYLREAATRRPHELQMDLLDERRANICIGGPLGAVWVNDVYLRKPLPPNPPGAWHALPDRLQMIGGFVPFLTEGSTSTVDVDWDHLLPTADVVEIALYLAEHRTLPPTHVWVQHHGNGTCSFSGKSDSAKQLTDDDTFLKAIASEPHNDELRLLYGDWLAQLGDPRGEFIRLCHKMRRTPVWADEYWQLKARRNAMWEQYPLEWLEDTGYDGSYYDPIFRDGVPDGCRERWRLIREFIERWRGFDVPDVGGRRLEIEEVEERLDLRLSPSICEFIAFAHDLGDYGVTPETQTPGPWLFHCAYFSMWPTVTQPALSLINYTLDSGVLAVKLEDLDKDDPPTYFVYEARDEKGNYYPLPDRRLPDPFPFMEPTVSLSVFQTLFIELPTAGSMEMLRADVDDLLARLAADFPIHVRFDDADIFESDEMLVYVNGVRGENFETPMRRVEALMRRPIPSESIPKYLFGDWDPNARSTGRLGPEEYRKQLEAELRRPRTRLPPFWMSVRRRHEFERAAADPNRVIDATPSAQPLGNDDIPF